MVRHSPLWYEFRKAQNKFFTLAIKNTTWGQRITAYTLIGPVGSQVAGQTD
jgi:hypothetical protein